jgi:hypothetical protein
VPNRRTARPVVKRSVSKKARHRETKSQMVNFKTSSWYQKAALSISAVPSIARRTG